MNNHMDNIIMNNLVDYILQLSEALGKDTYANNRPLYTTHLVRAATMLALLYRSNDLESITNIVVDENRNHGWSYLQGAYGEKVNKTWNIFYKSCNVK